jgi:arsenate reductase
MLVGKINFDGQECVQCYNIVQSLISKPYIVNKMKKIYHLTTCSTNQRILAELKPGKAFVMQDIKKEAITPDQLDEMKELAGSYESLFSRVAMKFRSMGLNEMKLTEKDYRKYILQEYTFLKRPVIINGNEIFIGNAPKTVAAAKESLGSKK